MVMLQPIQKLLSILSWYTGSFYAFVHEKSITETVNNLKPTEMLSM